MQVKMSEGGNCRDSRDRKIGKRLVCGKIAETEELYHAAGERILYKIPKNDREYFTPLGVAFVSNA